MRKRFFRGKDFKMLSIILILIIVDIFLLIRLRPFWMVRRKLVIRSRRFLMRLMIMAMEASVRRSFCHCS